MSELTDALGELDRQFGLKELNTMERMQPGLSRAEIAEMAKPLPFALPEEAIEFFEWRNGLRDCIGWDDMEAACFFEGSDPMSLQRAIELYFELAKVLLDSFRSSWFPLFGDSGGDVYCIDCAEEIGAIWYHQGKPSADNEFGQIVFKNLTKMIATTVVCFEQDAYYWDEQSGFEIDFYKSADIALQENPDAEYWKIRAAQG